MAENSWKGSPGVPGIVACRDLIRWTGVFPGSETPRPRDCGWSPLCVDLGATAGPPAAVDSEGRAAVGMSGGGGQSQAPHLPTSEGSPFPDHWAH